MNILILNASPKSKGSASAFYSSLLRPFLAGCKIKTRPLCGARDYKKIFELLPWTDAVVISAPVYVDAAPSHVTAFLEQAEQLCQEQLCHFKLYAISNCGFIEGHQYLRSMVPAYRCLLGRRIGDRRRSDSAMDVYADSVVRRVRYCAADPDGAGSTADCANNLFLLQQCARDACDEPRRSDLPCRYGTPYQTWYMPQKSVHSLPDAVIFVHPRFGHFYAALCVSTRKPAAHTIPQAQMSCSGERNTPMKLPLEDHLPYAVLALTVLALFYGIYFTKMLAQKQRGIQTRQIGRRKEKSIHTVELLMSAATLGAPIAQLLSIAFGWSYLPANARFTGFCTGMLGDAIFLLSVLCMKDSWRAGIPDKEKTELVTTGIYRYSRNPAFLGFDFMYIGVLLMYCNSLTAVFSLFAIITLHLQILQEEQYLTGAFGTAYQKYMEQVHRYLGRKSHR